MGYHKVILGNLAGTAEMQIKQAIEFFQQGVLTRCIIAVYPMSNGRLSQCQIKQGGMLTLQSKSAFTIANQIGFQSVIVQKS